MKRLRLGLTAIVLTAALWVVGAPLLARALIVSAAPSTAEAMMVLSGSAAQAERLDSAARLVAQGRARLVILTDDGVRAGWSRTWQGRPRMVERARDILMLAGMADEQIVQLPGTVRSTYDEAVALRVYVGQHPLRTVLVVTSAYHSRRALWVFRRVLRDTNTAIGIEPAEPGNQSPPPERWWTSRRGWRDVGAEYPKFVFYLFQYR